MTASPSTVLVVCGLAAEARIAAGKGLTVIAAPPAALEARLADLGGHDFAAVVSFGLAGGLDPALGVGDLVVATRVARSTEAGTPCDMDVSDKLAGRLRVAGIAARRGLLLAADAPIATTAKKRIVAAASGAIAVDTESHLAGDFATCHGLPFATLRVVCDRFSRDLPQLALNAIGPDGQLDFRMIGRELVSRPGQVMLLPETALATVRALLALRRVRRLLGSGLGLLG